MVLLCPGQCPECLCTTRTAGTGFSTHTRYNNINMFYDLSVWSFYHAVRKKLQKLTAKLITFHVGTSAAQNWIKCFCYHLFGYYCFNPVFLSFVFTIIAYPDSLNPDMDPDLAFLVNPDLVPVLDPVPTTKNLKNSSKLVFLFLIKTTIYLSLGLLKDVHAIEEPFSPQKRTSSTSKTEIYYLFYFCGSFRIRIHNTGLSFTTCCSLMNYSFFADDTDAGQG